MSQLPSMPMWWGDFFNKTDHLSNAEQWAYAKLLAKTWLRNCTPFPDNNKDLARLLGLSSGQWIKIRPRIEGFFDLSERSWRNQKLETVWADVAKRMERSRENGKFGGRPSGNEQNQIPSEPRGKPTGSDQVNGQGGQPGNPDGTQTEPDGKAFKVKVKGKKEPISDDMGQKETAPRYRWKAGYPVSMDWIGETYRSYPKVDGYTQSDLFFGYWTEGKGRNTARDEKGWHQTWIQWVARARNATEPNWIDRYGYDKHLHGQRLLASQAAAAREGGE